jgi:hypothetical protein
MGRVRVRLPAVGFTLLAMANALWKMVLVSSKDQVIGSVAAEDQKMVIDPPEVGLAGDWRVRAETNGATTARRLSLQNIFRIVK